ncbi:hypothetical protein G3I20_05900 [Streptomyces sp. SID8111]|uniref:hypothetical protein n=1 Tax=Streptomyces sp. SID8111 TaxID=2706100 RepID=UPI0013C15E77|nr:hypothetical protein [Streptomyces sp. SID8111]NEC26110.1 hypothetical protein [Streptomyces sp. SID8111]
MGTWSPLARQYRPRPLYRRAVHLPDTAYKGFGTSYLKTLQSYIDTHFTTAERSPR